ncbi:phage tail protein [Photobacterium atrarenae]|uniref:Phage tail protein n=1 Tax=Photobacterium atrarenae TaxID=865757 RepID=A0ABY5GB22_9GAMM|nr:phage tail protein [Photobacterium atrarenae]UTV26374.1 phage tail protein [Photobacterium atrarenae]
MAQVMLSLGGFKFHIGSAAYNELVRTWQWRWNAQSRIGQSDLLQYTGQAAEKISLNGEIATAFREVGTRQIEKLAELGHEKKPLLLVSGLGDVMGYWVMTDLNETNTNFVQGGLARYQTFTLELAFYGNDLQNP